MNQDNNEIIINDELMNKLYLTAIFILYLIIFIWLFIYFSGVQTDIFFNKN